MSPEKGLTHGPLDATFGQTCVKLSLAVLDDDMDIVDILDHFTQTSGLYAGTREGAKAYILDEAAELAKWGEEVDLAMSALTCHEALSIYVVVSIWVP
jgi:hypothetical protein